MIRFLFGPFRTTAAPIIEPMVKSAGDKLQKCVDKAIPPKVPAQPPKIKVVQRSAQELEDICWKNFDRQMNEVDKKKNPGNK